MLLQLVAKGLLTDYASDFEDMDQLDMVRFVANIAVETVVERTAVHKMLERVKDLLPGGDDRWDQEAGLLDPDYQLAMLRFREEHVVSSVSRGGSSAASTGGWSPGTSSPACRTTSSTRPARTASGSCSRRSSSASGRCPRGDQRTALALLCDLHALHTIESDRGWFMEHGRLSSQRSKAISREVNDLCRKLRPLAVDLVDAFGVPEEMLDAEMLEPGPAAGAGRGA